MQPGMAGPNFSPVCVIMRVASAGMGDHHHHQCETDLTSHHTSHTFNKRLVMDLTDILAPFEDLLGDSALSESLKETARLYFNNNSINVNPFGSMFEAFVLAAVLVALLSYLVEVKVEKTSDYGLATRSDSEYRPYINKLQRQVGREPSYQLDLLPSNILSCSYQVSQLEEVTDLQDALDARGVNHFDYLADSASY